MPRPLTKKDIAIFRKKYGWSKSWTIHKDKKLGIYLYDPSDRDFPFACEMYLHSHNQPWPRWITAKSFRRKQKLGHSKPRKKRVKQIMSEPDFGLDEMAIAEAIINEAA